MRLYSGVANICQVATVLVLGPFGLSEEPARYVSYTLCQSEEAEAASKTAVTNRKKVIQPYSWYRGKMKQP